MVLHRLWVLICTFYNKYIILNFFYWSSTFMNYLYGLKKMFYIDLLVCLILKRTVHTFKLRVLFKSSIQDYCIKSVCVYIHFTISTIYPRQKKRCGFKYTLKKTKWQTGNDCWSFLSNILVFWLQWPVTGMNQVKSQLLLFQVKTSIFRSLATAVYIPISWYFFLTCSHWLGFNAEPLHMCIHGEWLSVLRAHSLHALITVTKLFLEASNAYLCLGASNHMTSVTAYHREQSIFP